MRAAPLRVWRGHCLLPGALAAESLDDPHPHQGLIRDTKVIGHGFDLEGLIDIAASRGLKSVAVIYEDTLLQKPIAQGAIELAKKRGLQVVLAESYRKGTTDFGGILRNVKTANPDVLAAATYDSVVITQLLKELGIDPKMFALTVGVDLPQFYDILGRGAEFVYGPSQWEAELVALRAGGLIPIARQYPGAREFVASYRKEFPGADLSYHSAAGYGGCQVLMEAIRRAGYLDSFPELALFVVAPERGQRFAPTARFRHVSTSDAAGHGFASRCPSRARSRSELDRVRAATGDEEISPGVGSPERIQALASSLQVPASLASHRARKQ
jgi:hypothetical protein